VDSKPTKESETNKMAYRIGKFSSGFIAIETDIESSLERKRIKTFLDEGSPVILANEIKDVDTLGIDSGQIQIVEMKPEETGL